MIETMTEVLKQSIEARDIDGKLIFDRRRDNSGLYADVAQELVTCSYEAVAKILFHQFRQVIQDNNNGLSKAKKNLLLVRLKNKMLRMEGI